MQLIVFLKGELILNLQWTSELRSAEEMSNWVRWRVTKTLKEHLHDCDVMAVLSDISCVRIMPFSIFFAEDSLAY